MHFVLTTLTFPIALSDNALEGPRVSYLCIIRESTESDKRCHKKDNVYYRKTSAANLILRSSHEGR
jgi:hypothetical protein